MIVKRINHVIPTWKSQIRFLLLSVNLLPWEPSVDYDPFDGDVFCEFINKSSKTKDLIPFGSPFALPFLLNDSL